MTDEYILQALGVQAITTSQPGDALYIPFERVLLLDSQLTADRRAAYVHATIKRVVQERLGTVAVRLVAELAAQDRQLDVRRRQRGLGLSDQRRQRDAESDTERMQVSSIHRGLAF